MPLLRCLTGHCSNQKQRRATAVSLVISRSCHTMRIFFHSDQLKHNPKHEILGGRVVDYMETPSRALSILAACANCRSDGTALGPVTEPRDNGMDPILAIHSAEFVEHSKTRNAIATHHLHLHYIYIYMLPIASAHCVSAPHRTLIFLQFTRVGCPRAATPTELCQSAGPPAASKSSRLPLQATLPPHPSHLKLCTEICFVQARSLETASAASPLHVATSATI